MTSQDHSEAAGSARRFQFGNALFDEERLELLVDGKLVDLERKPLEVLRYFLQHPDKVVTRDQLAEACWPGRVLSDTVLSKTLSKLRAALLDDDQDVIKTVHGYGYRLVAPVFIELPEAAVPLTVAAEPRQAAPRAAPTSGAERRQLTVLFCDLVDSSRLASQLDPEEYRELLLAYQNAVTPVVERFEGHVAQYLGDGILIYFGHPHAHEDDAERAIRAGYDILLALKQLNTEKRGHPPINARIGIHTGQVVVGEVGGGAKRETLALGESANIAARLQSQADSDSILISDATRRLVPGLFILQETKAPVSIGERPVAAYQVMQPSGVATRLEAAEKLTPFINREAELGLLSERWHEAETGQGQACLLWAEPGLGKSRLALSFHQRVQNTQHSWLECRASPLSHNSAFAPVIELLRRGLILRDDDSPQQKLERLERGLDSIGADRQDAIPLLMPLLGLPLPQNYKVSPYSPEMKRRKTIELLIAWILALAERQPLALVFEDLQWADPSSLELLGELLEQVPTRMMFVLMTARPDFEYPWSDKSHFTRINVRPMAGRHIEKMLMAITEQHALPDPVRSKIAERSSGVPLFIEEITKDVLESGQLVRKGDRFEVADSAERLAVPATLKDSLMARLDRLGGAKAIAQHCAAFGREIPYAVLAAVVGGDEAVLKQQLAQLTDSELLFVRGTPPDTTYLFKHALIQDTAYESLLKSTRQKLHHRFAETLERDFKAFCKDKPEVVAAHFEQAGVAERAVKYYKMAGEACLLRGATTESLGYIERALKILASFLTSNLRDRIELELSLDLGWAVVGANGYGDARSVDAFSRAVELSSAVGDVVLHGRSLTGLWTARQVRGELPQALELADKMQQMKDFPTMPGLVTGMAELSSGRTRFHMGEFDAARGHLETAVRLFNPVNAKISVTMGQDGRAASLTGLSLALWMLGYPVQAQVTVKEAIVQAESNAHPLSIAYATTYGSSTLAIYGRNPADALTQCRDSLQHAERYGFGYFADISRLNYAVALGMNGQVEKGITMLREGGDALRRRGIYGFQAFYFGREAEMWMLAGKPAEAVEALEHAFEICESRGQRDWESELHRIKGELRLARKPKNHDAAEACFRKALEVSRAQKAKSLELRAATSLARLWSRQARPVEARELLAPVYDWFTEGLDTPDHHDAGKLLRELAQSN